MPSESVEHLRVLIASERPDRLERVAVIVAGLGHEVIARQLEVTEVGQVTRAERPTSRWSVSARAPTRARADLEDRPRSGLPGDHLARGARPGVRARGGQARRLCLHHRHRPGQPQSAIDIVLHRFAEFHNLEGAFGRRAVIEQAKGILMARHAIDQDHAFEMLRTHSQHNGRKLVTVAEAIVESHLLLLPPLPRRHRP